MNRRPRRRSATPFQRFHGSHNRTTYSVIVRIVGFPSRSQRSMLRRSINNRLQQNERSVRNMQTITHNQQLARLQEYLRQTKEELKREMRDQTEQLKESLTQMSNEIKELIINECNRLKENESDETLQSQTTNAQHDQQ